MLHGGIVASMLDEVGGRVVMIGDHTRFTMTAKLEIRYRRPTPLGQPLTVVGRLLRKRGRLATAHADSAGRRQRHGRGRNDAGRPAGRLPDGGRPGSAGLAGVRGVGPCWTQGAMAEKKAAARRSADIRDTSSATSTRTPTPLPPPWAMPGCCASATGRMPLRPGPAHSTRKPPGCSRPLGLEAPRYLMDRLAALRAHRAARCRR